MSFKPSSMKQGYHQWYSAKYFDRDESCAEALRILMDKLVANKRHKPFIADLTQNLHIIVSELSDPNYYNDLDEKISIKDYNLVSTYDKFVGYKKSRIIMMQKLIPTFSSLEKKEVICYKEGDSIKFKTLDKEVTPVEMKKEITEHLKGNNEEYKIEDNKKDIFIAEISCKSYAYVETTKSENISVEKKVSAEAVVNFIENIKENVIDPQYSELLSKSMTSKQNEIPISYKNKEGKKDYVQLVLPNIIKHFMNKEHYFNNQDVAEALVARFDLDGSDKSALMLEQEFIRNLEPDNQDEMPSAMLFNPSWLERCNFEKISRYCPIYTGYKSCAWVLKRVDGYPGCMNKETLKMLLTMIMKFAKFYGLWVRGGLQSNRISRYINDVLRLTRKKVYGFALHENLEEWIKPLEIRKFKESSLFTVKEDTDIFDDPIDVKDFDSIFDGYTGPSFVKDDKKKLDRDEGELDEKEKPKRGKNNHGLKRAKKKMIDKHEKKKKKKKSKKKKDSSSSEESSGGSEESKNSHGEKVEKEDKIDENFYDVDGVRKSVFGDD